MTFLLRAFFFYAITYICYDFGMSFMDWQVWAILSVGFCLWALGLWEGYKT